MHDLIPEHEWTDDIMDITPRCPKCQSPQIEPRNIARRLGGDLPPLSRTS